MKMDNKNYTFELYNAIFEHEYYNVLEGDILSNDETLQEKLYNDLPNNFKKVYAMSYATSKADINILLDEFEFFTMYDDVFNYIEDVKADHTKYKNN